MPTHADSRSSTNAGVPEPATAPDGAAAIVALYRRVAAHAPLPIAMTAGRAHRLCGANPAFCQLLGAESEALLGQSLVDAVPASDTVRVLALLDQVYHTGAPARGVEPQPIHPERDQVYWNYIARPARERQADHAPDRRHPPPRCRRAGGRHPGRTAPAPTRIHQHHHQ